MCTAEWCGWCYTNLKGRTNVKGHRGYRVERDTNFYSGDWTMQRPKDSVVPEGDGKVGDPEFEKQYPSLFAFLFDDRWDDGEPRETGTLFLFRGESGAWGGCVNDRDYGRVGFVHGSSFKGLLKTLDKKIGEDTMDWRKDKKAAGKRRK